MPKRLPKDNNDETLNLINSTAKKEWGDIPITKENNPMWVSHWELHAQQLADKMKEEGLIATAKYIESFIGRK